MIYRSMIATLATGMLVSACSSPDIGLTTDSHPAASTKTINTVRPNSSPGSLTYYHAPSQAPYSGNNFVLGPANSIWYVSGSATAASKITQFIPPAKKKTFTLTSVCNTSGSFVPSGLVNGADGRLWFGSLCGGIGAIDISGKEQSYGLPTNCTVFCSTQLGAVSGGEIWFTCLDASHGHNLGVGFIDAATGISKIYGVDVKNGNLSEIVQGPDGNFWFGVNSEIGRVTPQGSITLFPTKPKMLSVSLLLFGSDGALWFFSGEGSSKVGRMSTSGTMLSETQTPSTAYDAAVGSDGNVWFTTSARSNRSSLVEMTSSKTYSVVKAADKYKSCVMNGLANGPDGNLWFGDYAGNSQCLYGVGTLTPND